MAAPTEAQRSKTMSDSTHEIESDGAALVVTANDITVTDAAGYEAAADYLRANKQYQARVSEFMDPICDAAHKAHRVSTGRRSDLMAPAKTGERIAKGKMLEWQRAEDARRREAAEAEAAERRRVEEERLLAAAEKAEARGDTAKAKEIVSREPRVAPVVVAPAAPKVKGVSIRTNWDYEVVDEEALPREWMAPDLKGIAAFVRRHKDATNIPGVRVFEVQGMAAGR